MGTHSRLAPLLLAMSLAGLLLSLPGRAEAKGLFLITYGDSVKELAEVPPPLQEAVRAATGSDVKVGYCYSYLGLFWLDLWTWGGKHCLFRDRTIWRLQQEQAAELLQVPLDKLKKPLMYSYPPLLVILLAALAIFLLFYIKTKVDEGKADALLKDPRYGRALELLREHHGDQGPAIQYLVSQGVAQPQAAAGVAALLRAYPPPPAPPEEPPVVEVKPPTDASHLPGKDQPPTP